MSGAGELERVARHWRDWMAHSALPRWAASLDAEGLPYEALTHAGAPDPGVPRRTRTLARQLWTHAVAERLGLAPARLAARLYPAFMSACWAPDGKAGFVHSLTPDAAHVIDARRDLYDHGCALMALAAVWDVTRAPGVWAAADTTLAYVAANLRVPGQPGYAEDDRGTRPRRQNSHMHLFEALLEWSEVAGVADYRDRCLELAALCVDRFVVPGTGALREFLADDLGPLDSAQGRSVEPGHLFEWVQLLGKAERLGLGDFAAVRRRMFAWGWRRGRDARGFAVDEIDLDGVVLRPGRRVWHQLEMLHALADLAAGGDRDALDTLPAVSELVFAEYFAPALPGLWLDARDAAGAPATANSPASTLYHALAMLRALERAGATAAMHKSLGPQKSG